MANLYEILTLINPDETDDGVGAIIGGLRQQLTASGGDILAVDNLGRRKLAYKIQKKDEGHYVLFYVEGPANLPGDFRAHTKIRESIFREMILKLGDAHETAVRAKLAENAVDDAALAAAQIAAAEERAAAKRAALAAELAETPVAASAEPATEAVEAAEPASEDASAEAAEPEVVEAAEPEATAEPEAAVEPEATAKPEAAAEPEATDDSAGDAAESEEAPASDDNITDEEN